MTNVHLIRTIWSHWGAHSGINQFVKYVDSSSYSIREQLVVDGNRHSRLINRAALHLFRHSGMEWYKLNDLLAEAKALPRLCSRGTHIIHYLDADHTAFLLPQIKHASGRRTKVIASYHQPPEILAEIIPDRVAKAVDRLIVVSPEQASHFEQIVGPDRVRLILHGIDTDFFRPGAAPHRSGPIRCLTVGFWLRDFDAIGAVADRLAYRDDIEFHIVAPETGGLQNRPNVKIHQGISDDSLRLLYQEADLLFLPLLKATANNALLEGIASGLPVVSTRLPSVETYLEGTEAVLVNRNEPSSFVDAICRLADDAGMRERMARSSRARAEQLDWRQIAKQYEDVYAD